MLIVNKDQSYQLEKNALYLANACHLTVMSQGQFVKTQRLQKNIVQRKNGHVRYAEAFQILDVKSKQNLNH